MDEAGVAAGVGGEGIEVIEAGLDDELAGFGGTGESGNGVVDIEDELVGESANLFEALLGDGGFAPGKGGGGSEEYFVRAGGTEIGFVRQIYADLLGRAPSPGEEEGIIAVLRNSSRTNVALLMEDSVEFDGRAVQGMYQKFLARTPASGELQWGITVMRVGATEEAVSTQIMGSPEFAR